MRHNEKACKMLFITDVVVVVVAERYRVPVDFTWNDTTIELSTVVQPTPIPTSSDDADRSRIGHTTKLDFNCGSLELCDYPGE